MADPYWDLVSGERHGVLATVNRDGGPQMSNVLYVVDDAERLIRISTTADRRKARNVARDPRVALHVTGPDFWHYAVAEGTATLSAVAGAPGDEAVEELRSVHTSFYGVQDEDAFAREMIDHRRLVIRLTVSRVYGVISTAGRRPTPAS